MEKEFWKHKDLSEMNHEEWELLCDGCAKCCLVQLQDEQTDQLVFTDVVCHLLDQQTCRCTSYEDRSEKVPSCMTINIDNIHECAEFAPPTCAYRLLLLGEDLPEWHPLVSGDNNSTHDAGISVKGKVISARDINDLDDMDLQNHIVDWPAKILDKS